MYQKKSLENLGSKNIWHVIRFLCNNFHLCFGITEISKNLSVSKSNIYRALGRMEELGLVCLIKTGKKKLYRMDSSSPFVEPLWELVMTEKYMGISPSVKNAVDLFINWIADKAVCSILLGSVVYGSETKWSDIDICVVSEHETIIKDMAKTFFPDYRLEVHAYSRERFEAVEDFVVLESLLHGIPVHGKKYVYSVRADLRKFPRAYLIYRLNKVKEIINKAKQVDGEAKDYFEAIARTSLGEIKSILNNKTTLPKRAITHSNIGKEIGMLENEIAKRGEVIWLT